MVSYLKKGYLPETQRGGQDGSEEFLIPAFLERENMTNLWKGIELWLRDAFNQHIEISVIDIIFGINNDAILVNMTIFCRKNDYHYLQ